MTKHYILYACDRWKSWSSMRFILLTHRKTELYRALKKEFMQELPEGYTMTDFLPMRLGLAEREQAVAELRRMGRPDVEAVNRILEFGYIEERK